MMQLATFQSKRSKIDVLYDKNLVMRFLILLAAATLPAIASEEFSIRLYPALEKAQCRLCHNDNGVASSTRLQFPRASATPEEIDRFGLRLREIGRASCRERV